MHVYTQDILWSLFLFVYVIFVIYFKINYRSEIFRAVHIIVLNTIIYTVLYVLNYAKTLQEFTNLMQIYIEYVICDYCLRYVLKTVESNKKIVDKFWKKERPVVIFDEKDHIA